MAEDLDRERAIAGDLCGCCARLIIKRVNTQNRIGITLSCPAPIKPLGLYKMTPLGETPKCLLFVAKNSHI